MGQRLLVVGGNAAGMSAAAQARRLRPDLEIVAIERGRWTSYANCAVPQLSAGVLHSPDELVVRTPDQFRAARIDVRTEHEVTAIDLGARRAEIQNLAHGRTFYLGFDTLLLATGARTAGPPVAGSDLPHVHTVQSLDTASRLLDDAKRRRPRRVVVMGGGYVGMEMAEAFQARGAEVTVLEPGPEILPGFEPAVAAIVARAARAQGIGVQTATQVEAVTAEAVRTSAGDMEADLVVVAGRVEPDAELGAAAGLETGDGGGLIVDRRQRTSAEGVWAAGDCCLSHHAVSGRRVHHPFGTVANKQGRVAGVNIAGGYAFFPGVLGTVVTKVCGLEAGRTGLGPAAAEAAGYSAVVATVESTTSAAYLPGAATVTVSMVAERSTGRLLGADMVGGAGTAGRLDVVATALAGQLGVGDLVDLDLGHTPTTSPLWDPLQVAARQLLASL